MVADEQGSGKVVSSVGVALAKAREAAGLTIEQVSAQTRVRERHLLALEKGDFAAVPGRTYVVGFAKSYARAVGLNEAEIGAAIAREFERQASVADVEPEPAFAPGDPARVPSSAFAWAAGIAVLVLAVAGFFWWHATLSPAEGLPSLIPVPTQAAVPVPVPASAAPSDAPSEAASEAANAATGGAVVFTAQADGLWVKFYDGAGKVLLEKLMAKGETYTVPADAASPQIWTGRPEALSITIGGKAVAKLSDTQKTMKNVPVSAQALLARGTAEAAPAAVATPAAGAAPVRKVVRARVRPVATGEAAPVAPAAPSGAEQ